MFLTPVFTALEYGAFRVLGVGTWQARTVPVASGLLAVGFLMAGLAAVANRRAALVGGSLLAANYVFVMWNRAALMESTMTSLIRRQLGVAGARAEAAEMGCDRGCRRSARVVHESVGGLLHRGHRHRSDVRGHEGSSKSTKFRIQNSEFRILWRRLDDGGAPCRCCHHRRRCSSCHNWSEYRFYNWQMSVVPKSPHTRCVIFRTAPHGFLSCTIFSCGCGWVVAIASLAILGIVSRWRTAARPSACSCCGSWSG